MALQLSSNHHHLLRRHHHHHPPLHGSRPPLPTIHCALTKQSQRFLTSLSTTYSVDDFTASNRLIRKFVNSSTKSIALDALSYLLSPDNRQPHLSSLALPMYSKISEAPWFNWNPKIVADLAALLDKQKQFGKAEALISETVARLGFRERDLVLFYGNLIESHSKHKSETGFMSSLHLQKELMTSSSSVYVKRRAFESMVGGLCTMDRPREAEDLMEEMRDSAMKLKSLLFEFKSLVYSYGRLGLFDDMKRCVAKMEDEEGLELDTVCANMVLSSFGSHGEISEMVSWLRRMKGTGIELSIRTYNSVLNYCPMIMSIVHDFKNVPTSIQELREILAADEVLLVEELIGSSSSVLEAAITWDAMEGKLDLHGMHLSSAYVIMLQWREEIRRRLMNENGVVPAEVTVVCGAGKHSNVRGESPVKDLVKQMMVEMNCPMRIDRNNVGCFIAKGRVLKDWFC